MLHYYFESKEDLLIYCVRIYKEGFVDAIRKATEGAEAISGMHSAFCEVLVDTILSEADVHRLWYDIRTQAMFDETFVPIVSEIENMMQALLEVFASNQNDPVEVGGMYARIDGVFRFLLNKQLNGMPFDRADMLEMFRRSLR